MGKFSNHFLMTKETVKQYVIEEVKVFPETAELRVSEIGDGNINYVFRVEELLTGKSVIVKQADKRLRSSGRLLAVNRNKIEADSLQLQYELVPHYVPKVYDYNEMMCAITMEDIAAYKNLRYALMDEEVFPTFSEDISQFLAETLLSTTDLCWERQDKKRLVQNFINPDMCDISEDLVFTEPYNNYKNRNVIIPYNQAFVQKNIYQNEELIHQVANLRIGYMNNAQSLLHGDLHSGSIFVQQQGMKVIDPEFAFYGPMGYDIGNVIGNLFFPLARSYYYGGHQSFQLWMSQTIDEIFNKVRKKLEEVYEEKVALSLYKQPHVKKQYINDAMTDALGYAGTEIIRRVIGDSKVKEVTDAPLGNERVQMERWLLTVGIELIIQRKEMVGEPLIMAHFPLSQKTIE